MSKSIRTFKNVRARVCRTKDGTWHAGWVSHLDQEEARIRLQNFLCLDLSERFIGECYGDGTMVRFAGCLLGQAGQEIALRILGSMQFEASRDSVRFQIDSAVGTLSDGSRTASFMALDG